LDTFIPSGRLWEMPLKVTKKIKSDMVTTIAFFIFMGSDLMNIALH
jgi:hypothetical protein